MVSCRTLQIAEPRALNLEKDYLAEPWNAGSFRKCPIKELNGNREIKSVQGGSVSYMHKFYATTGDPKAIGQADHANLSGVDSVAVAGLETWRRMTHQCASSTKTCTSTSFKQTVQPVEWNSDK